MSDRRTTLLFAGLVLALLVLMAAQVRRDDGRTALGHLVHVVTSPVVEVVTWSANSLERSWDGYVDLLEARRERDRLREEVARLEARVARLSERARESERLRHLLDLRSEEAFGDSGVVARVLTHLEGGLARRVVVIDRGSYSGIGRDWVAIQGGTVVGRVLDAAPGTAQVLLTVDPDSGVAARHRDGRFAGVALGLGGSDRELRLEYVPRDQPIAVGDAVVTSGLDRLFPPGLLVGYVRELSDRSRLTWTIRLEAAYDPAQLEELLLVPPLSRSEPEEGDDEAVVSPEPSPDVEQAP
jgi:rod shape-determining protein MreC